MNIKVFLLKNGQVIIGNDNEETNILENIFSFFCTPIMAPTGEVILVPLMIPYGGPINHGLIDIEKDNLGILKEITEFDSELIGKYSEKVESLNHPDIVVPKTKSKLII